MKRYIATLLLLAICASTQAREVFPLNEGWRFFFKSENSSDNARHVTLPHTWNTDTGGTGYFLETTANYQNDMYIPAEWATKRLFVKFYGVQSVADVFVNGYYVGGHKGGGTAFALEITDKIRFGSDNALLVVVSNNYCDDVLPTSTDMNLYGGIYREAELILTEKTAVSPLYLGSDFDYKGGDEENTVDVAEIGIEKQLAGEEKSEYVDGNYRWSIKLNEDWSVNEYYGFYNKVTVIKPTSIETDDNFNYGYGYDYDDMYYYSSYSSVRDPLIMISTYSNPNRQSAADWAKKNRDDYEKTVNSEKYKISEIKETQIGQIKAYYFEENYSEDENEYVEKTYYMNYGDFRYKINLGYDKREEEAEGFKESADAVIKSFVPGEININELGDALESDSDIDALNVLNEFKGDIFSINYPCLWNVSETDTGLLLAKDRSKNGMDTTGLLSVIFPNFSLMLSAADGSSLRAEKTSLSYYDDKLNKSTYTLEEYMYKNIAGMLNSSSSYLNISMPNEIEEVTLMGKKGYKADLVLTINGVNNVYYTMYFIPYDSENLITVIKACNESEKNTVYENALDKALNSLKLS